MPSFVTSQDRHVVSIHTPEIELAFSLDDGGLRMLRRVGGPNVVGYGDPFPSVDVLLGTGNTWMAGTVFVRYLSHEVGERDAGVEVVIVIGIGPLKVYDRYRITGTLLARYISVQNVGEDEVWLRGVRMSLPWARVGSPDMCRFDTPANSVRPRVPLSVAAEQRRDVLPRRFFAPGLRDGRALAPAPTEGPGLLTLSDPETDETMLCWYYSTVEAALPQIEGNGQSVMVTHQLQLCDRLRSEVALNGGMQYILLLREPWPQALAAFQRTWSLCGRHVLAHPATWVRDAAIYEVHAAQFGGFRGLAAAVPHLRAIGLNTLCLMPVWEFANLKQRLWDGNWVASGNPYALQDFERIDPTLGTADDLRLLIDTAHGHDLRVVLDLPMLGCASTARYVHEHPEWFCFDGGGHVVSVRDQPGMVSFDWANRDLQEYVVRWAIDWARSFDLDGYRPVVPRDEYPNWGARLPYHAGASSLGFLQVFARLRHGLSEFKADCVLLGDMSGPVFDETHDFALDELAHSMFLHLALNRMSPVELGDWLDDRARILPAQSVRVCFTESHRTRLMSPLADGLRGSRISRMLLAGMLFCGFVPMILAGQEYIEGYFISQLLYIRESYPALRRGSVQYNAVPCSNRQVFVVLRTYADEAALGVLNVGPHKHTVSLSVPVDTLGLPDGDYVLHELVSNTTWDEDGRQRWARDELLALNLTLEPFEAYCFVVRSAVEACDREASDGLAQVHGGRVAIPFASPNGDGAVLQSHAVVE